jgi:hypothetical protein
MSVLPTSPDFTPSLPARRHRLPAMLAIGLLFGLAADLPAQTATIHGFVSGHDEQGENAEKLSGAKVEILSESDSVVGAATTNENGYFNVGGLSPGKYRFRVNAEDYLEHGNAAGFQFGARENAHVMDFVLTKRSKTPRARPAVIRGTVVGVNGDQRSPVSGALVILNNAESATNKRLSTDDQGKYQTEVLPGDWQAKAMADGYERAPSPSSISVAAGGDETLDFELIAKQSTIADEDSNLSIHGFIVGHNEKGEEIGPIAGATITFSGGGTATTNENGYYLIKSIKPGQLEYRASANGYLKQKASIQLSAKSGVHVLNLILSKGEEDEAEPALLAGRVLEEVEGEQRVVPDAVVKLDHLTTRTSMDLPVSKDLSAYRGEKMDPGKWRASVTAPGFEPYVHRSAIALAPGEQKRQDFSLKRVPADRESSASALVSVETTAETPGGTPQVQFVNVTTNESVVGEIQTDRVESLRDNETTWKMYLAYPKSELPAGDYQAVATLESPYENDTNGPKSVEPKQSTVFNLTLRIGEVPAKPALLAGRVFEDVDGKQQPIPDAVVTLDHLDTRASMDLPVSTDLSAYRGEKMDPGQWRASVAAPGFKPYVHKSAIALAAGEQKRQDFILESVPADSDPTASAMVSVEVGKATEGIPQVQFVNVDTGTTVEGTTDDSNGPSLGGWKLLVYYPKSKLPPGQYSAEAKLADHDDDTNGPKAVDAKNSTVFNLTLRIAAPKPATIAGKVFEDVDGQRQVIPDAVVRLDYIALGTTTSKELPVRKIDGKDDFAYSDMDMQPGRWRASVTASEEFEPYVHPSDIDLKPGEQKRQDFVLKRRPIPRDPSASAMVSVQMTDETEGTPHVQFVNVKTGLAIDGQTYDSHGQTAGDWKVLVYYPTRKLPKGEYRAHAKQAGYADDANGPKPVDLGKSTVFNLTLRPVALPKVGGMLVRVLEQYGDAEPEPVSEAIVTLLHSVTGERRRILDGEDGDYYADSLDEGRWKVAAKVEGLPAVVYSGTVAVFGGRDSKCEILIKVQPPRIYTLVGVPSYEGEAFPEVQFVSDHEELIPAKVQNLTADLISELGIRNVPEGLFKWFIGRPEQPVFPGKYYSTASLGGYDSKYDTWKEARLGQDTAFMILLPPKPKPEGHLLVKVVDPYGRAIPGASVKVANVGVPAWDEARQGYVMGKLPPGDYLVDASVDGWELVEGRGRVTIVAGQLLEARFTFKRRPPPLLIVKVVSEDDSGNPQPVSNASVLLRSEVSQQVYTLQADGETDGIYYTKVDDLKAERFSASVRHADLREPHLETIQIDPDKMPHVIVIRPAPEPLRLLVRVLSEDEVGIQKAVLRATVLLNYRVSVERTVRKVVEGKVVNEVVAEIQERSIRLQEDKGGIYFVEDLKGSLISLVGTECGYAVQLPGADDYVRGTVKIPASLSAVIVIKKTVITRPIGPTVLRVRVWKRKGGAPAPTAFVFLENQTVGKKFRKRLMKRKVRDYEEVLEPGNYHVTAAEPGAGDEGEVSKDIVLKKGHFHTLHLYLDTNKSDLQIDEEPGIEIPDNANKVGSASIKVMRQLPEGGREPIAGATVYLRKGQQSELITLRTNDKGVFYAPEIEVGQWRAIAQIDGSPTEEFSVTAGQLASCEIIIQSSVRPSAPGSLLVNLTTTEGQPVSGKTTVWLKKLPEGDWKPIDRKVDGRYYQDNLVAGQYQVFARFQFADDTPSQPQQIVVPSGRQATCTVVMPLVRTEPDRPIPPRPRPVPDRNEGVPAELVGTWNVRVGSGEGNIVGAINIKRDGTFQYRRLEGERSATGNLALSGDTIQMTVDGRRTNLPIRSLASGRLRVGEEIWERPGRDPRIPDRPIPPRPRPEQPDRDQRIPAGLIGIWSIREFEGNEDKVGYIRGTVNIGRDGTFVTQSRQGRKQGRFVVSGGHIRFEYSNGERPALLPFGEVQGKGFRVGDQLWERPGRPQEIPIPR